MAFRETDEVSILDLLAMYTAKILEEVRDPCTNGCLPITLVSISLAKRVAKNIHTLLVNEENMSKYNGLFGDFDFDSRTISLDRIVAMAMICAGKLSAPGNAFGVENLCMDAYHRSVSSRTSDMVALFTTLAKYSDPTDFKNRSVIKLPEKAKARCLC